MTEGYDVTVSGFHFEEYEKFQRSEHLPFPVIIVSDSAGPIPRENQGVLEGWGSNLPSYSRLIFDDEGNLIRLNRVGCSDPRAKPRLAVALDYLEIRALLAYAKTKSSGFTFSSHNVDLHGGAMEGALAQVASGKSSVSLAGYYKSTHIQGVKIFSALCGVPFIFKDLNRDRSPNIQFNFNWTAIQFPKNLRFHESRLIISTRSSEKYISLALEYSQHFPETWIIRKHRDSRTFTLFLSHLRKSKNLIGYLSFRLNGDDSRYNPGSPWNIRIKCFVRDESDRIVITIFRDVKFNELPNNLNYLKEYE